MMSGSMPTYVAPERSELMKANQSNRYVEIEHSGRGEAIEARIRILERQYHRLPGRSTKLKRYLVAGVTRELECFLGYMTYDGAATRCCEFDYMEPIVFWGILHFYGLSPKDLIDEGAPIGA